MVDLSVDSTAREQAAAIEDAEQITITAMPISPSELYALRLENS